MVVREVCPSWLDRGVINLNDHERTKAWMLKYGSLYVSECLDPDGKSEE